MDKFYKYFCFFILSLSEISFADPAVNQLPQGSSVVSGSATVGVDNLNPSQLNVIQSSPRAIINWQSFDVGQQAIVHFNQPDSASVTLNKINSNNPSQIHGQIRANGQVILQNAAGVYFGKNSIIDVGAITATTHSVNEDKFMQGSLEFNRNGSLGSIVNDGEIRASLNGYVALLAPEVRNHGLVVAQMGSVVMASGEKITLNFNANNHLSSITTTPATVATLVENKHAVRAHGGTIILSAKAMSHLVSGVINQTGTLDVGGDAFNVVKVGGRVFLGGDQVTLAQNSVIDAAAPEAGGEVTIEADQLIADATSVIDVSATQQGNGGAIHIAAVDAELNGTMLAMGGAISGDGGQINIASDNLVTAESTTLQAGSQTEMGAPGHITIETNTAETSAQVVNVINQSIASANVTVVTDHAFNFDATSLINKTSSPQTTLTINAAEEINMAGQIMSDALSPLNLSLMSTQTINFAATSNTQVAYLEAAAPEINALGNIWTYGGQSSHMPFMQITASRLLISRTLRSGSLTNRGSVSLSGNRSVEITSTASIIASCNEGGLVDIISEDGLVSIAGMIQTNGSSGRGGNDSC